MSNNGPTYRLPRNVVNYHKLLYGTRKPLNAHTLRAGGKGIGKYLHHSQWLGRPGEEDLVKGVSNTLLMAGAEVQNNVKINLTASTSGKSTIIPFSSVHDTEQNNSTISKFLELLGKRDIGHTAPYRVVTLFSQFGHTLRADHYNYLMSTAVKNTRSVSKGGENITGSMTKGPHAREHSGGSEGWYQALKCYSHMTQRRRVPNMHTWCILMEACRKGALVGASIPSSEAVLHPQPSDNSNNNRTVSNEKNISTSEDAVGGSKRISLWLHALSIFQQLAAPGGTIYGSIPALGFMSAINSARFSSDWRIALKTFSYGVSSSLTGESYRGGTTSNRASEYIVTAVPCVTIDAGVITALIRSIGDAVVSGGFGSAWHSALSILTATHCPKSLGDSGTENGNHTNGLLTSPSNAPLASLGSVNAVLRILNYSKRHEKVIEVCQKLESVIRLSPNQTTLEELHEAHKSHIVNGGNDPYEDPNDQETNFDPMQKSEIDDDGKFPLHSVVHQSPSSRPYRFPTEYLSNSLFTVFNWTRSLSMPIPENILTDIFISLFRNGMNKSADTLIRSMVLETCQNPGDSNSRLTTLFSAFTTALLTHPDPFVVAPAMLEKHRHRVEASVALNTSDLGEVGDDSIRWVFPIADKSTTYAVAVIDAHTLINKSLNALLTRYNMIVVPCSELIKALRASGIFTSSNPSTGSIVTPIRSAHPPVSSCHSSGPISKGKDIMSYMRESTPEMKVQAGYHISRLMNGFPDSTMSGNDPSSSGLSANNEDNNNGRDLGYTTPNKNIIDKNTVYESIGEIISSCFFPSSTSKKTLRRLVVLPYAHEIYSHRFLVPPDTIRTRLAEATSAAAAVTPKMLKGLGSEEGGYNAGDNENVSHSPITVRGESSVNAHHGHISHTATSSISGATKVTNALISDFLSNNSTAASCLAAAKMLKTLNPSQSTVMDFALGVGTGVEVTCIMSNKEDRKAARMWDTKYCSGLRNRLNTTEKPGSQNFSSSVVDNQVTYATPSGIRLNSLVAEMEYIAKTEEIPRKNKNEKLKESK